MAEGEGAVTVPATTLWRSPDAARPIDEPILRDGADPQAWAAALDREERFALHGRIESQLLLGEPVILVGEDDGWTEVCAPWQPSRTDERGYRGWVRTAHLGAAVADSDVDAVVATATAIMRVGQTRVPVSWATRLPVLEADDSQVLVALPAGTGVLARTDVDLFGAETVAHDPLAPVAAARLFLGLPYLWGGATGWGLDCSGLVHQAFRSCGIRVPRDASDQRPYADPVDLADAQPGDLYFFATEGRVTHVGFATSVAGQGPRTMLHAPEDTVYVEDAELAADRTASLVTAGRIDPGQSISPGRPAR